MLYLSQEKGKEIKKMKARNEAEAIVIKMMKEGKNLHGEAREIAIEMALREMEEAKSK